jgi:hypothetical protein
MVVAEPFLFPHLKEGEPMDAFPLIAMVVIYIAWFLAIALLPIVPLYVVGFQVEKYRARRRQNGWKMARLRRHLEDFLHKHGAAGEVCACTRTENGGVELYAHVPARDGIWEFSAHGKNLAEAEQRLQWKLRHEAGECCLGGNCPNARICPSKSSASPLQQILRLDQARERSA